MKDMKEGREKGKRERQQNGDKRMIRKWIAQRRDLVHPRLHKGRQSGQSLVLIALLLPALLGVIALAIDGGYAYAQRRQMQNAADAAAVAGARAFALQNNVNSEVSRFTSANGASSFSWRQLSETQTDVLTNLSINLTNIEVTANVTFDTFFARIVGINQMTATATARARVQPVNGIGNMLPIIPYEQNFVFGQEYNMWDNVQNAPGGFGWVNWDGGSPSTPVLVNYISNPASSGVRNIGDWVHSMTGVKSSSQVRDALSYWLNRPVIVPMYDQVTGSGSNAMYRISGFAQFIMTSFSLTGNPKTVRGRFAGLVMPGNGGFTQCLTCMVTINLSQ